MQTPTLIAHRGGSLEAPENTMAAFRRSIKLGVKYVELDVQLSKDGRLMVIHDETLDRTTDGSGPVREHTFDELRKLDAGSKFNHKFAGEKIPTLREVLELCAGQGAGVVIEIKSPELNQGVEQKVVSLVGEMRVKGAENVWCISFNHASIRKMRALDATLPLGYLYSPDMLQFAQPDDNIQAFCPFYLTALQNPDQVAHAHEMGKLVFVWTVNQAEEMLRVAAANIDGMVSDRPSLMLETLGRRQS